MKTSKLLTLISTLTLTLATAGVAQAGVAYNITGWDTTGAGGQDGGAPANWIGGSAPSYTGSMNAMWYANFTNAGGTQSVSSTDARSKGADANFALAVGPRAWNNGSTSVANQGQLHGSDYGLIHLDNSADLTLTLSADTALNSNLKPGFSLFQGWDTGSGFVRTATYINNANNPNGTVGLNFVNSAASTVAGGSATYLFSNLAAGDYTMFIGGNAATAIGVAGKYTVGLTAAPVPVPAAAWLFSSALAGLGFLRSRKQR